MLILVMVVVVVVVVVTAAAVVVGLGVAMAVLVFGWVEGLIFGLSFYYLTFFRPKKSGIIIFEASD